MTKMNHYRNRPVYDAWTPRLASPAQQDFIKKLLAQRTVSLGLTSVSEAAEQMGLERLTSQDASTLIDRLQALPVDPDDELPEVVAKSRSHGKGNRYEGRCDSCGHTVPAQEGYYFVRFDGKWAVHHKAGACSTAPAPAPVQVHEGLYKVGADIILVYKTQNGRLAGKVLHGKKFVYQQGAVARAATGTALTAEEAAAYGHATGHCCACGRELEDERSTTAGYGPVCAKRYGWPWGDK